MATFSMPILDKAYDGETYIDLPYFKGPVVIKPSCDENKGNWYCVTHGVAFENQLQKDIHTEKGSHKLAWNCHLHGLEQP